MTEIIVSAADAPLLLRHTWCIDSQGYASATVGGRRVRLHRLVMCAGPGQIVDHINRHKLDCRRENLRFVDCSGNARNSSHRSHNTSGYRGVYLCRRTGRWRAEIRVAGRGIKLGRFDRAEDAARAYDAAAVEHHGEFAVVNFGPRGWVHWREFTAPGDKGSIGRGCD